MTYVGITVMVLAIEFGFVGAIAVGFYMYDNKYMWFFALTLVCVIYTCVVF